MKTWNARELATFLDAISDHPMGPLYFLIANTGLRRGEALALRWRDVDLDAGRVSIRHALTDKLQISEPKTNRGRRSVALDQSTVSLLREHRRHQLELRIALGAEYRDEDLVFARRDGSPLRPGHVSRTFTRLAHSAGVPAIRLHDLRHTHVSLAFAAGIHPKVVSDRVGHHSTAFTLDRYAHAVPAVEAEAAERVASLVSRAVSNPFAMPAESDQSETGSEDEVAG